MKITVTYGSKSPKTETFDVKDSTTVEELKDKIHKAFKVTPNSQGLKFANPAFDGKGKGQPEHIRINKLLDTVSDLRKQGLSESSVLSLKNNGAQVPYRWFFFTEYFGPMPIMLFFSMRPEFIYGAGASSKAMPLATTLAVWAFVLHFVKRELETLFLHKFSKPSAPVMTVVKNSAYYWGFAAVVSYFVCHPAAAVLPDQVATLALGGMALMEVGNFAVHFWFASQRKADKDAARPIPKGALFFVSCPNYFFEIAAWCFFSVAVNNNLAAWAFTLVGGGQMAIWAMDRHKAYVKQERSEGGARIAQRRSAVFPFIY